MTLRTLAIPNPAPGTDWTTVVPGNYLYDVSAVTATLTTTGTVLQQPMTDDTGNGEDGTYGGGFGISGQSIVAGLVSGDTAVRSAAFALADVNPTFDWFAGDYSVGFWEQGTGNSGFYTMMTAGPGAPHTINIDGQSNHPFNGFEMRRTYDVGLEDDFFFASPDSLGLPQFILWTYEAATGRGTVYLNGVLKGTRAFGAHPMTFTTTSIVFNGGIVAFPRTYDEMVFYTSVLSAGDAFDLYAAGVAGFDAWNTAAYNLSPIAFYHLDDGGPTSGRQVALRVTNGNDPVALIDAGFAESAGAGPFAYSWQPHLQAATQTPNGQTTTVPIPRLLLPAGYTIGSDTLDIGPLDQWSDITLWWDDAFQDSLADVNPYVYPPGVKLVYRPQGAT